MPASPQAITDRIIDIASGSDACDATVDDRRLRKRQPYTAVVAFVQISPKGERSAPMLMRARDLAINGIGVTGKRMLYPGTAGAMQLIRSDGRSALVGVRVKHCRYAGDMLHHIGLLFAPLASGVTGEDFLDRDGRLSLLDPEVRQSCP